MTTLDTPPEVAPAADWRFPAVHECRLDNGLRVLAYNCPGQFVIAASLLFDVPLNAERRDIEGVAGLTARTITQGAGGRDAEAFADALAACGADLEGAAFPDGFAIRLSVPVSQLATALGLMADVVRDPEFAPEEFEHEKHLRLQEIDQARSYPSHVAVEQLNAALFGTARAARPVGGTTESVQAVARGDAVAFAQEHLQPASATLILAGDFGDASVPQLVDEYFGSWGREGGPVVPTGDRTVTEGPQLIMVDWPEAPQSTVRVAGPGITRADDRWPSMFVANYALGGNFSSRINTVLREEKGLTYGASSTMDTGRAAGVLGISTSVRSSSTVEALSDIIEIMHATQHTISDSEVAAGVRAATDSAPLGFERSESVVGRVEMLLSQRLPLTHVDANLRRIRQVTTETVNDAYAGVVRADAMTVVVVGDASTLGDPLSDWGYADLRLVGGGRVNAKRW